MSRWETWLSHLSISVVTVSGVAYLWMKYFLEPTDPFAVVNHPWQPAMLSLHVLAAPVVTFLLGLIVSSHVRRKLANGSPANRRSGLLALASFPLMVVSGYMLQVTASAGLMRAAFVIHLVSSGIFAVGYVLHQIVTLMLARLAGRTVRIASVAVLILIAGAIALSASPTCRESTRRVFLMGTEATLSSCAADRDVGMAELEAYLRILEDAEAELSTWKPDSAISRLNRRPVGAAFPLTQPLTAMMTTLYSWHERTGGAFDPGIGALVRVWGIHEGGRIPAAPELQDAIQDSGLRHFVFDADQRRIVRQREASIDVGAFGKGEALDRVLTHALAHGGSPFLINLGGQILAQGLPPGKTAWDVALAHPRHREREAVSVRLVEGSLATSAGSERDMEVDGHQIGHIVDPRTGRTIAAPYSVTVWHSSALAADILSTALFVMGPADGIAWADANDIAALFQTPETSPSRSWREKFENR